MKFSHRVPVGAAVVVASIALAACGSAGSNATRQLNGKTAVPVVAITGSKLDQLRAASTALTAAKSAHVTMKVFGAGLDLNATGDVDTTSAAMDLNLSMNVGGQSMAFEERLVGGVLYMKLPAVASLGTKPWLKIDGLGAALGQLGGSSPNPTSQAELLRGLDNVKTIGREEIDGVGTTHYTGTIDFKKALAETQAKLGADSPLSKQLAQSQATFGDQMVIPASVWIDDQYRPRRIEFSVTAAGKTVQMTMDYSNFGEPVVVTAPPASDVQDMSSVGDLLGQLDPTTSTLPGV